jgi:hypothetical protein
MSGALPRSYASFALLCSIRVLAYVHSTAFDRSRAVGHRARGLLGRPFLGFSPRVLCNTLGRWVLSHHDAVAVVLWFAVLALVV